MSDKLDGIKMRGWKMSVKWKWEHNALNKRWLWRSGETIYRADWICIITIDILYTYFSILKTEVPKVPKVPKFQAYLKLSFFWISKFIN